jgi:hypothetical protein
MNILLFKIPEMVKGCRGGVLSVGIEQLQPHKGEQYASSFPSLKKYKQYMW